MNHLYTTFRLSKPTSNTWSSVFGYKPVEERAAVELGGMYAILSIATAVDFSLEHIGGMIFDELQYAYFGEEDGSASMQRFEQTLHAVKLKIEQILDKEEKISASGLDLEMSVVVFRDSVLYGAVIGESHIFVQRDGQLNEISGVLADPDMDGFMRTGSLRLTVGDKVLLATDNIDSDNTFESLSSDLEKVSLERLNVSRGVALLIGYHAKPVDELVEDVVAAETEIMEVETEVLEVESVPTSEDTEAEMLANFKGSSEPELNTRPVSQPKARFIQLPSFLRRRETPVKQDIQTQESASPLDQEYTSSRDQEYENSSDEEFQDRLKIDDAELAENIEQQSEQMVSWQNQVQSDFKSTSRFSQVMSTIASKAKDLSSSAITKVKSVDWRGLGSNVKDTGLNLVARMRGQNMPRVGGNARLGNYRRPRTTGYDPKRRRLVWGAAIIVGLVVIFGIRQNGLENERRSKVATLESQINKLSVDTTQLAADAETAAVSSQTETKEQVVSSANSIIAEAKKLASDELASASAKSKALEVQTRAQAAADKALKVKAIAQTQVVNNLAANFPGAAPSDIELIDNKIYVADPARNVVYRMDTQLGSQAAAVLSDLAQPYLLTADTARNLIVVDKNPTSVVGVMTTSNNNFRRVNGLTFAAQGELAGIDIWTNKAIYAVSKDRQAITRQTQVGQGYQTPNYNSPWRRDAEFGNAKDIHVDFQIYVLLDGQGVKRYVNSQPDTLNFRGILPTDESAIKTASSFLVTPTKMYLADSVNQRVLVFVKDIANSQNFDYAAQYKYRGGAESLTNMKEIVTNAEETQLFVLSGTTVVRIDL